MKRVKYIWKDALLNISTEYLFIYLFMQEYFVETVNLYSQTLCYIRSYRLMF